MTSNIAVYFGDDIVHKSNKMGISVLHFSSQKIVCVINKHYAGRDIQEIFPFLVGKQIVKSLDDAKLLGANTLLFGLATPAGAINEELLQLFQMAIDANMKIIHGFHESPEILAIEQKTNGAIENLRIPQSKYLVKSFDRARNLKNIRVLMVGTDMAVGKMTTALLLDKKAKERNINSEFLATGQVGIAIAGFGVPLDAVKLDFAGGAIETLVLESKADLLFIEGQGSIINPASASTLALIRGSAPTHLVLCHDASLSMLKDFQHIEIPSLEALMDLYETVAFGCGLYLRPETVGICVNTSRMDSDASTKYIESLQRSTGKVVLDPVKNYSKLDLILERIMGLRQNSGR